MWRGLLLLPADVGQATGRVRQARTASSRQRHAKSPAFEANRTFDHSQTAFGVPAAARVEVEVTSSPWAIDGDSELRQRDRHHTRIDYGRTSR